jgi:hypothetical protein
MENHGTFCTVFDCMDGRCQDSVGAWCKKEFGTQYADTITIAGLDGVLPKDQPERERAQKMAKISAEKHGSKNAVVVGHSNCAGFPVSKEEHAEAIKQSVKIVKDWGLYEKVVGLFMDVENKTISEVCRV